MMMMMAVMRGLDTPGCAILESRLHIGLQLREGALGGVHVARLEGLTKGGEVVLYRVVA
jgi:hypothetical protein